MVNYILQITFIIFHCHYQQNQYFSPFPPTKCTTPYNYFDSEAAAGIPFSLPLHLLHDTLFWWPRNMVGVLELLSWWKDLHCGVAYKAGVDYLNKWQVMNRSLSVLCHRRHPSRDYRCHQQDDDCDFPLLKHSWPGSWTAYRKLAVDHASLTLRRFVMRRVRDGLSPRVRPAESVVVCEWEKEEGGGWEMKQNWFSRFSDW